MKLLNKITEIEDQEMVTPTINTTELRATSSSISESTGIGITQI
jgi:hypothetical protein